MVTGGARGLGACMCKLFSAEGAKVIALDVAEMTYEDDNVSYYFVDIF